MPGPIVKKSDAFQTGNGLIDKLMDYVTDDPFGGLGPVPLSSIIKVPAKAAQLGFKVPVWHGTSVSKDFNAFKGPIATDHGDFGIHVATDPMTAEKAGFASLGNNQRVLPLVARIEKPLEVPDIGRFRSPDSWRARLNPSDRTKGSLDGYNPDGTSRYKAGWETSVDPSIQTNDPRALQEIFDAARQSIDNVPPEVYYDPTLSQKWQETLLGILKQRGYDSLKYRNFTEGLGEPSYAVLDPANLRSIFANFDPKLSWVKDLLAGLGGAGAASTLLNSHNKEQ